MKLIAPVFLFLFSLNSFALEKTEYEITCKNDDCFRYGWIMKSKDKKYLLNNSCFENDCEMNGWDSIDINGDRFQVRCQPGGNVTCGNFDWSKFGGVSFWRGKASKTVCNDWDCYTNGWYLTVY